MMLVVCCVLFVNCGFLHCCVLFVVCCFCLFAVYFASLCAVRCLLFVVRCVRFVLVGCSLFLFFMFDVRCLLSAVCSLLRGAFPLFVVCCSL